MNFVSLAGGRPSKFLYSGKNKTNNPWSTNDKDYEDDVELALQPKTKFLKTNDTRNSPGTGVVFFFFKFLFTGNLITDFAISPLSQVPNSTMSGAYAKTFK